MHNHKQNLDTLLTSQQLPSDIPIEEKTESEGYMCLVEVELYYK